jgi:hypothetical protein
MGIERKIEGATLGDRLKGAGLIICAAGSIYFGKVMYDESHSFNNQLYENASQRVERSYLDGNKNYLRPSKDILEFTDKAGDIFMDSIPFILLGGGIALGISGVTSLTNLTYRRK